MDETTRDPKAVKPGIPEALHPEIGNGALLQNNRHAALLRSPDPLKSLDSLLFREEKAEEKAEAKAKEEAKAKAEEEVKEKHTPITTSPITISAITTSPITTSPISAKEASKTPKAGKRIRKVVKTVGKQEKVEAPDEKPIPLTVPESTLSPYTQWLKSLRGSEYVHPYDDDFALEQGTRQGREGISETFADLLAVQGYTEQAVEMYQKLMEKYPEKSGFFAAKIKALE